MSDDSSTDFEINDYTLIIKNLSEDADKKNYTRIAEKLYFLIIDYLYKPMKKSSTQSEFVLKSKTGPNSDPLR